ncbi:hypothetical protein Tco_0767044 [Tanacetum coccineum]
MNPQETQQVVARDEKWVPSADIVKISSTNLRLETTVPQKEETFQVMIDVIKNSTCFKAFTISVDCRVDAEVFREILDICPIVKGEEFTKLQNDDDTLTFLLDLGYKGPLHKYTNMYVDHMSQPWRTLATIINKSLSGKTVSNDRLKKSKIDIMWDMFYKENVDYPVLIWEDFAYQIDHRKERRSRRENMPYPRFTKIIINYFLKQHKSLSNLKYQHYYTIKDDGIVGGLRLTKCSSSIPLVGFPPKKSRGKGSQGKKIIDDSQETVDVSEESEPEPVKKKTACRRVVKKKVTLSADDNIIFDDPDAALKLGKSMSLTEAEEAEAARKKSGGRSFRGVTIQDTPSAPKLKPTTSKPKLKGAQSLTPAEKEATDIMQALKESKKTSKRKPGIGVLSEGNGTIPWVPDASTVIFAMSSEGTEGDANDEGDDHIRDTQDTDDEDYETEFDEDDIYKYKIHVRKYKDVEMTNAEFEESRKAELPPTSSSLSISSGFGDQFLKLSSDTSLVGTAKDTTDTEISSLLDIKIQSKVPHIQSLSVLRVPVSMIPEPTVLTPVQETSSTSPITTLPLPSISTTPPKSASEILKIKREQPEKQKTPKFTIKSTDKVALKEYDQKSSLNQTMHANKSFNRNPANHKLYHALIEALIEDENAMDKGVADTLQDHKRKHDDDEDPLAGPNQGKQIKRRRTKESESFKKPSITKETPKGKAPSKGSKTGKSASAKEPVEKPVTEVVMDDASEDVVRDDDQPQDSSKPKTAKTPNQNGSHNLQGFLLLIRNETSIRLYLINSNKLGLIKWSLLQKDPVTFNDLMATLIDFSKYVLNRLKIDNLTQYILLGPAYNLLKGTSFSSVKLEYHFQECFNALKDKLDWNNLEGDRYSFDLSKPLPLQGHPCHLTVAADYFFNNDLDYLKSFDPERISQLNKFSKHNVYSTKKILGFKEGDFVDLHLNDIEDMLLLVVQHKLFHLTNNDIVDFIMALRMFTRSLVIKKRVKDLQLELYTPSHKPPGVIYEDLAKQKRVMRADELYKFSDRMLKKVRDELRHRVCNFGLESNKEMPRK